MTDDLVKRLREVKDWWREPGRTAEQAADRIEKLQEQVERLERNAISDAKWLAAYHKWCEMNGCAPSSRDLSIARAALGEKKDD